MSRFIRTPEELAAATAAHTLHSYIVGLDLGQSQDPTAESIIQRRKVPQLELFAKVPDPPKYEIGYRLVHLKRLDLGTPYPAIVRHVRETMNTAPLTANNSRLVVDGTGVGRPVVDLFRQDGLKPVSITITGGDGSSHTGDNYRVSKLELVSQLQAALHDGLLEITSGLRELAALVSELQDFQRNQTATGYSQFSARVGKHDDMVLSVAVALWFACQQDGKRPAAVGKFVTGG